MTGSTENPEMDALRAQLQRLIGQLERARSHANTMLHHLDTRDLARLGAHGFSVQGHLTRAAEILGEISTDWAEHSAP